MRGCSGQDAAEVGLCAGAARKLGRLKKRLRRNIKESLRKCYNSLKRDGLSFRLEVVTETERD